MRTFASIINPWQTMGLVAILLLVAVACGGAAAPAANTPATQPQVEVQPTAVPTTAAQPAAPAEVEIHPGKVTQLVPALGTERFDYAFAGGPSVIYLRVLHGMLISTNPKTELIPGIATDWSVSSDGLSWTYTIRKGVKFHDGTDLTAEDVLWTWQHYFGSEALEYVISGDIQRLSRENESIELIGSDQIRATFSVPQPSFAASSSEASGNSYGTVMPKRDTIHDEAVETAYEKDPIGTGFGKLVRIVPAEVMEFERFDDFYYQPKNGLPEDKRLKFTTLEMVLIPEEATRVAAIRAGEADIAPVSLQARDQVEAGGGRLLFTPEAMLFDVQLWGCYEPLDFPCKDKRVRQALDYAIDKEIMRDELYGGTEVMRLKGWNFINPSTLGYSPGLDPRPFDPEKARQLMAEAGFKTPTNPEGKDFGKLVVKTWVSQGIPFLPESAQLAVDFWKRELGIDAEVQVGDQVAIRKQRKTGELFGQVLWRDNEVPIDAAFFVKKYADPDSPRKTHNDPELFKLAQEALAVVDPEEQQEVMSKLYRRFYEETHRIGIGYINLPWAVGPRIKTWEPYPIAFYPASSLYTITLK